MTTNITDSSGNVYGFNQDTGLISKNSVIVSSEDYEPCFLNSPEGPVLTGIYLKKTEEVLTVMGQTKSLTDPEVL